MAIEVYDNFLPEQDHQTLQQIMLGGNFPWFFSKTKVKSNYPDDPKNFQFTHMVYYNYVPMSELWQTLDPIIRRINAQAWLRTKANLTPRTEEIYIYGMHVDIDHFQGKTAVYYVNDNNGVTWFKRPDGSEHYFDSKANRLVVFDAQTEHSGTSCSDEKVRCVINFNFLPNPSFNLSDEDMKRIKHTVIHDQP